MKLRNVKEGKTMPYVLWVLDGDDRQWKMYKGVNDAKKFISDNDYDEFLDALNTQIYPNGTYYNNYIDWIVIPAGEEPRKFDTHKFYNSIKTESKKRSVKESYSDIWSDNAWDAYDIAMEYLGAEGLCEALAKAMGTDELANNLKYIFRVNEIPFMDDEDEDEEEFDESCGRKSKKSKKSKKKSMKEANVRGNFHGIPDMKFVWYNTQSDPGVIYDGKYFNANVIDDTLYSMYREYCDEFGVIDDQEGFDQWVSENHDEVYELIYMMIEEGNYETVDEVPGFGPFRGGWRANGDVIYGESKKRIKKNFVNESQASSAAYLDFQHLLSEVQDFIDEEDYLFTVNGTKFAGSDYDTFEIVVRGAYTDREITTIIIEHSNKNMANAWSATFDYDGEYDDISSTYIDGITEFVKDCIVRLGRLVGRF